MTHVDAPDMVVLTDLAFPGFFRPHTYQMGAYYAICIGLYETDGLKPRPLQRAERKTGTASLLRPGCKYSPHPATTGKDHGR
jgi:hypothetical protein